MAVPSLAGTKFFVTFIDEASNHLRVAHRRNKGEAAYFLKRLVKWMELQTELNVKLNVLDGGKEYLEGAETLEADGIEIKKSAWYISQENGRAERMNRTINHALRAMLINTGAPVNYWAECLCTVANIRNRILRSNRLKNPEEELTGLNPSVEHIKTFGCNVWVRIPDKIRKKMKPKAKNGVLLRSLSYGKYRIIM